MSARPVSALDAAALRTNPIDSSEVSTVAARVEAMKGLIEESEGKTSHKFVAALVEELPTQGLVRMVDQFGTFIISPKSDLSILPSHQQRISGNVTDLTSFFRAHTQLQSLNLEDCTVLQGIQLSETLPSLRSLTLVNLPRLEPSCFSELMDVLPWGRWPNLKMLTIKNCPLFNDETCAQISKMLENGLTHLVLEDLPNITCKGIVHLMMKINRQIGHFAIESLIITGLEKAQEKEAYQRLQVVLENNASHRDIKVGNF